jgi:hypothetical protein
MRTGLFFVLMLALTVGLPAQQMVFSRMQVPVFSGGQWLETPFTGGFNAPQVSEADLNNDGLLDLVVFDRAGFVVMTYLNNGATLGNPYRFAPEYACAFPNLNDYVLLRDFNGDGAADIFCTSHQPGTQEMQVYEGFYRNDTLQFKPFLFSYPDCSTCNPLYIYYPANQPGFWNNLFIARSDVPGIADLDGDGDLDILAFAAGNSTSLYWMKNTSVESGYGLDSLHYVLADRCWSKIYESGLERCRAILSPDSTVCASPLKEPDPADGKNRHPGATITPYDQDGDGDMDLILGGINNDCLTMLTNGGAPGTDWMTAIDTAFPSYDVPLQMQLFIGAYHLDLNNDGRPDLLATVNNPTSGEDRNGMWFYANTASQGHTFELQSTRFLTGQSIDLGTATHPTFADVNGDGLLDLVVGTYGFYSPGSFTNARLNLFLNTGTPTEPRFTLADSDFLGFSQYTSDDFDFAPTFGDMDGDGDLDLLVGSHTGIFYYFRNSAGPGNPMNLKRDFNPMWANFLFGLAVTPMIVDLNGDGKPDIVAGERNGNLNYFENKGTASNPVFNPTPDLAKLGNIDTRTPPESVGFSVPVSFVQPDGALWLLTGAQNGALMTFRDVSPTNNAFPVASLQWGGIDEGNRSHPALADLDGDGKLELVVGNRRGGLSLFRTELEACPTSSTNNPSRNLPVTVWPNPATGDVWLHAGTDDGFFWRAWMASSGLLMGEGHIAGPAGKMEVESWPSGVYIVTLQTNGQYGHVKLVVQH